MYNQTMMSLRKPLRSLIKSTVVGSVVLLLLSAQSVGAFQQQVPSAFARKRSVSLPTSRSLISPVPRQQPSKSSTARFMTLEDISGFYATYPLQAAVLTCGLKASIADAIAQVQAWSKSDNSIEMRRNAAYIIYGGIFIGLMCHMEYDVFFPAVFGTEHNIETVVKTVLFDVFVSAPLMWLPPAYLVKAVLFNYSFKEGIDKYWADIKDGLLFKYWAVWLPALSFSFSTIPEHLRVAFMAFISFFWFIIFSYSSAATEEAEGVSETS